LLTRMLQAIGLTRENVRLANAVPWRPAGNRPPTPIETQICQPFIARQIELVQPKLVVCFGPYAAKAILNLDESFLRLRGQWQTYSFGVDCNESIPALPMLSPTYLLKHPNQKKLAWRDLQSIKARLDKLMAPAG
ncbi:MAG: uracil-DNA glycosylase, partial [Hyphomicrobiales bacterium]